MAAAGIRPKSRLHHSTTEAVVHTSRGMLADALVASGGARSMRNNVRLLYGWHIGKGREHEALVTTGTTIKALSRMASFSCSCRA